ncbi:MAG TPA: hypothetical protein PK812_04885 [Beijerinckiaceae bacterium]|nr:hypothetical protein [Beijerinckiaceae bacterium]
MKMCSAGLIFAALVAAAPALAQQAKPFGPTTVPCNQADWKNCRVSFDGSNVTRTYTHPRGGPTTETHAGCSASGGTISCPPGTWRTNSGSATGRAETLKVFLDASGRAKGTGH